MSASTYTLYKLCNYYFKDNNNIYYLLISHLIAYLYCITLNIRLNQHKIKRAVVVVI